MHYAKWLDENRARAAELARYFDITDSAVHQWAHKGVPVDRMAGVQEFTRGKVKVVEMVAERVALKAADRPLIEERRRADRRQPA